MAENIAHGLVHCAQVESLGDEFDASYLADGGAELERQARELAERVADIEMVCPAETGSST